MNVYLKQLNQKFFVDGATNTTRDGLFSVPTKVYVLDPTAISGFGLDTLLSSVQMETLAATYDNVTGLDFARASFDDSTWFTLTKELGRSMPALRNWVLNQFSQPEINPHGYDVVIYSGFKTGATNYFYSFCAFANQHVEDPHYAPTGNSTFDTNRAANLNGHYVFPDNAHGFGLGFGNVKVALSADSAILRDGAIPDGTSTGLTKIPTQLAAYPDSNTISTAYNNGAMTLLNNEIAGLPAIASAAGAGGLVFTIQNIDLQSAPSYYLVHLVLKISGASAYLFNSHNSGDPTSSGFDLSCTGTSEGLAEMQLSFNYAGSQTETHTFEVHADEYIILSLYLDLQTNGGTTSNRAQVFETRLIGDCNSRFDQSEINMNWVDIYADVGICSNPSDTSGNVKIAEIVIDADSGSPANAELLSHAWAYLAYKYGFPLLQPTTLPM